VWFNFFFSLSDIMMQKNILTVLLTLGTCSAAAQTSAPDKEQMTETAVVMLHAVRADCAAKFPALKDKLDVSFAKLRAQHQQAFNAAEGSNDFDGRVERMRGSIDAAKDKARYESVCAKLAENMTDLR
jgi:hypothetical protein